ncbi:MAG: class I SAM-dependent methyltransferase [Desulfobacteraceae bacterium]|nr:MAG: class I SAM-dependent methyltransferase [Desulfobacteraceae bacterium]
MSEKKFDPQKLEKLNNPQRLVDIPPAYIRDKLNMAGPGILVEIGAGTAFFCTAFYQMFKPSTIYACDISDVMIQWVAENISSRYPAIVPVKTDEVAVPLEDGIADLVFMINLHHELHNPLQTLEESFRLVKPGGGIFVVDWKKKDMPEGPPAEIRCLPEEVEEQMARAGFEKMMIDNELQKHFLVVGRKG